MAVKKNTGADVDVIAPQFTPEELGGLTSFADVMELLNGRLGEGQGIDSVSEEIGDGFKVLENKDQLIGVSFIIITFDFHMGDHGEYVSARIMTVDGLKYVLNDGSTGIRNQLAEYAKKKNRRAGLLCEGGLRRSDYTFTDESGQEKAAKTYYLDTSA